MKTMIIKVEMGEGAVSESPNIITTVGCGSCVVLALYDARRKIGGLAHVMLPEKIKNTEFRTQNSEGKHSGFLIPASGFIDCQFASTAIPALLEEMRKRGCSRQNITAKIVGGARMFSSYAEFPAGIGEQNVAAVRRALEKEGMSLVGWDTGGQHGRSVEFYLDSGRVVVKSFGRENREI